MLAQVPMTHASQHIKKEVPTTCFAIAINVQWDPTGVENEFLGL